MIRAFSNLIEANVRFVVLTSKADSPYADTPSSYEYPARYRRFFEPLETAEPMIAIIYEPRSGGRGRMAYVGWAALHGTPSRSPRTTEAGRPLWVVRYVDRMQEFPNPVPRDYLGEPVERWLRETPVANRNILSSGASVRWLEESEGQLILELGYAGQLGAGVYSDAPESQGEVLVAERSKRLVEAAARDSRFRRTVMSAYQFRCAVTGLSIGDVPEGRFTRLLDAAHIRPVGDHGSDSVGNGIAMTPTVHRLFDAGLITVRWTDDQLRLATSPLLSPDMIQSVDRGTNLRLDPGMPLILPGNRSLWPSPEQVRYHQHEVFQGPESLVRGG